MAGVLDRINKHKARNVATTTRADVVHPDKVELKPASGGFNAGIANMAAPSTALPGVPAEKKSESELNKIFDTARRNQVASMDFNTAMQKGDISPAEYVRRMAEKAKADGKELDAYQNTLQALYATDDLTPNERKRQEKMDAVGRLIGGVGDVVANAINTSSAANYGVAMDLDSAQKQRNERIAKMREKREALLEREKAMLGQALMAESEYRRKQADAKALRDETAAAKKEQREYEAKVTADARKYEQEASAKKQKFQADEAEKARKHQSAESAKSRAYQSEKEDKDKTSVVGKDGYTYRFKRPLEDYEIQRLLHNTPGGQELIGQFTSTQEDNNGNIKKYVDWNQAFAYAQANNLINDIDLINMGGRKSGSRVVKTTEKPAEEKPNSGATIPSFVKSVPSGGTDNSYWTKGYPKL